MNRLRNYFTVLNVHIAGAALLMVVVIFLGFKAILAVHAAGAVESDTYQQQQITYARLRSQMSHLEGLPDKVDQARKDARRASTRSASRRIIRRLRRSWALRT